MSVSKERIPALYGLRAISILMVVFGHLCGTAGFISTIGKQDLGHLGVRVFFVISGYLITKQLIDKFQASGDVSLKEFYLQRSFRILPACYLLIAALGLASILHWIHLPWFDLAAAATYLANFDFPRSWYVGHLWSLAVEEQFYLVWPMLFLLIARRGWLRITSWWWFGLAGLVLAIPPVLRLVILHKVPLLEPGIGTMLPTVADALGIGCILAMAQEWLEQVAWYRRTVDSAWSVIWPVAAVAALIYPYWTSLDITVLEAAQNILIAFFIHHCVRARHKLLDWKPMVWGGEISYSLYLWQQPFLNREVHSVFTAFPWNIMIALAIACLSFYLVEEPCRALWRCILKKTPWTAALLWSRSINLVNTYLARTRRAWSWLRDGGLSIRRRIPSCITSEAAEPEKVLALSSVREPE
ncbi:MAG TPA: acyltransferase [Bryobacteraceae bacterium]|nr:acyltransferase [Bryobacteraceae bacterium]